MPYHPKAIDFIALMAILAIASAPRVRADDAAEQLAAASALFDAKKYGDAAQKLQAFVTAYPKHARIGAAAFALGRCRAELKQWAQAVPAYEKAIASNDAAILPTARLGLGEAAVASNQFEKAVAALQKAVEDDLSRPQKAAAWFWLGQANFQLGKFPAAEEAYQMVVTEFNKVDFVDSAMLGSGLAALRQGKTDDARTRLRTMIQRFP